MDEVPGMPWAGIAKRTAQVAGAAFLGFTGLCFAELQRLRREKAEAERFKWTDAARWEK